MRHIQSNENSVLDFTEKNTDITTGKEIQKSSNEHHGEINTDAEHHIAEVTTWSTEDTKALLRVAENEVQSLIFKVALSTGIRQKELLGLTWNDIDTDKGVITVNGQDDDTTARKPNSTRKIAISEVIVDELLEHKQKQNEWVELVGELYQEGNLVFCTNNGTALSPRILTREMKRIMKEAKGKAICFSNLRNNPVQEKVELLEIRSPFDTPSPTMEYYRQMDRFAKNRDHRHKPDFSKEYFNDL